MKWMVRCILLIDLSAFISAFITAIVLAVAPLSVNAEDRLGGFETVVAITINKVVHLDHRNFTLGGPKPTSFGLYGKHPEQFEEIKCERSAEFAIIINANILGEIRIGVCNREAKRLRELAPAAKQAVDMLIESLTQAGTKIDQMERKKLGWLYEKNIGPNQSEIYYFPLIMIGHGILAASTAVLISEIGDKAIIVQANVMNLCDERRGMQKQTVLCSDTQSAVKDIAQRLFVQLKDK